MTDALASIHAFDPTPTGVAPILRAANCEVWGDAEVTRWAYPMRDAVINLDAPLVAIEAAALAARWSCVRRMTFSLWIVSPRGQRFMVLSGGVRHPEDGKEPAVTGTAEMVAL